MEIHCSCVAARRGFTLLELIIVVLLISISLAFSVPALRNSLVADELGAGSRKIISLIKSARSRAAAEGIPQKIFFDSPIRYEAVPESGNDEDDEQGGETKRASAELSLPEGVRIVEVSQATERDDYDPMKDGLWVSRQGYMDRTVIRLEDDDNRTVYLIIMPFFFDIRVEDEFNGFD